MNYLDYTLTIHDRTVAKALIMYVEQIDKKERKSLVTEMVSYKEKMNEMIKKAVNWYELSYTPINTSSNYEVYLVAEYKRLLKGLNLDDYLKDLPDDFYRYVKDYFENIINNS